MAESSWWCADERKEPSGESGLHGVAAPRKDADVSKKNVSDGALFWLVALAFTVIALFIALIGTATNSDRYHEGWCEARMVGIRSVDTLAVVRDDEFCVRVIAPTVKG